MVLDVGTGKGLFAKAIEEKCGARVICLDLADQTEVDVDLAIYDGLNFPFPNNTFDVVIFSFVLHHCVHQDVLIDEAKRICRGRIIVFEDNSAGMVGRLYTHLHEIVYSWQYDVKSPFLFRTQAQWKEFFEAHGLEICYQGRKWTSDAWYYHVKKLMFVLQPV
jgi:ubiquinone/menaquinone biosynthesis C-methylase UbiE